MRTVLALVSVVAVSAPAAAQTRVRGIAGLTVQGAAPIGDFSKLATFGFEMTLRGGAEILIGPGVAITPDLEVNWARVGATDAYQSLGFSSASAVGFMVGTRMGYEIAQVATPYSDFHLGYWHNIASGSTCDLPFANCSSDEFGLEVGLGADFWVTPGFGVGPTLRFNFDLTNNVTSQWLSFGLSATARF